MMGRCSSLAAFAVLFAALLSAQSTQGLIAGRLVDSETGRPIDGAWIHWTHDSTGSTGSARTGDRGEYNLPELSPGTYRLRVTAEHYQAQELQELVLPVASALELDFKLRPLHDVWEQGTSRSIYLPGTRRVLNFFGPDVDSTKSALLEGQRGRTGSLEATVSDVVDPVLISDLPFAGRDIYSALVLLPGVTSDGGTARGLGLVVNGQRPSSSNFFLDGVEYNDYLTSGPLAPVAPEAVQEYRVSTNNYSAEYGGTTGFIANAITRAGTSAFHGNGYGYFQNSVLNANDFQRNLMGWGRPSGRVFQPGFQVGGPVLKRIPLFFSSALEYYQSRTEQFPISYTLPTASFTQESTEPGSIARNLMTQYKSIASAITGPESAAFALAAPTTIHRLLALERLDYSTRDGLQRLTGRISVARLTQPDFIWSPFKGLSSPLHSNTTALSLTHYLKLGQRFFNEAKFAYARNELDWDRQHSNVPNLVAFDGTVLPSSPGLYSYGNTAPSWQFSDNLTLAQGRHLTTMGGGFLWRWLDGYLTPGKDGEVDFADLSSFGADSALLYSSGSAYSDRPSIQLPEYDRTYRIREFSAFVQDTFRITPRLTLNYGLRHENFGRPLNVGETKDPMVQLGAGATLAQRLSTAKIVIPESGDQPLFHRQSNNWEPRVGISWDPTGHGRTVVRGSFGIFSDRMFDNLWATVRLNDIGYTQWISTSGASTSYGQNTGAPPPGFTRVNTNDPRMTFFDPNLPSSRSYNYFGGVQQRLNGSFTLEVNALGSAGRDLITTDVVNRSPTLQIPVIVNPQLPFNLRYRGADGFSDYHALTGSLRYRGRYSQFTLSYTWSHLIDNQSEPLESDLFDFRGSGKAAQIGFNEQFASSADRGDSDFDQRHNLVFYSVWESPRVWNSRLARRVLRDWRFSQLAAFRTGFPYSVYANGGRADLLNPAQINPTSTQQQPGGVLLLNGAAFSNPVLDSGRNSGRNAFRGPGLYNLDIALSRRFAWPLLGEAGHIGIRADAFNVLNHANLGNPDNFLPSPTFGLSLYGRKGFQTGFPATAPLIETPRQIQLSIRVEF